MSDKNETLYGNVCSDCRKTDAENKLKGDDGDSRRDTGRTIDARTRVKSEADKKEQIEKAQDNAIAEQKSDTHDKSKLTEKKEIKTAQERKHRESFFLGRSFLTTTDKTKKDAAMAAKAIQTEDQAVQNETENTQQLQANKEERQTKNIDTTVAFQGAQTGFQEKHRRLMELTSWMGDTPMIRNIKRAMNQQTGKDNTPTPTDEPKGPSRRNR